MIRIVYHNTYASQQNLTKRIRKKHLEGLAYHPPVVGVGFIYQLFKVIAGENSRPAPVREHCFCTD